jgi:D-arabinose 1-dehydrogenase-like Zn-dependent alcohol dehydrogenase
MAKDRVVQVSRAGGALELVERERGEPGPGWARVRIEACGVCHSDVLTKDGLMPGIAYPRVPGHEVIGRIDAVGPGGEGWTVGQRVGVGWHGGYCGRCNPCRRGQFFACVTGPPVTGIAHDGGYGESMLAPITSLARVPDGLSSEEAAPLMCAGLTTFNALRRSRARAGEIVAVLGLGGLGHLGVQFAAKMGFHTVAVARGADKAALATKLGAHRYIDSTAGDPAAALTEMGGAAAVLATATDADAMSALVGGLAPDGELLVLGAPPTPLAVSAFALIGGRRNIQGCYSGTSIDAQDTLSFALLTGVRSMNEVFPLSRAAEAYDHMMSGKARFRAVLTTEG